MLPPLPPQKCKRSWINGSKLAASFLMRKFISLTALFILAVSTVAVPVGPVPRQAPELSFFDPSGKAIALSKFKGKVVALEFFFFRSMHCVRVAQVLNQLNGDLGSRGFQPHRCSAHLRRGLRGELAITL